MKRSLQLMAATAAVFASQAFALPPTATVELDVALSGASAQDNSIINLVTGLCAPGTLDRYSETGSVPAGRNAYFCEIPLASLIDSDADGSLAALDVDADTNLSVLIYKRSSGGSGQGPVGLCSTPVQQVVVNATCTDTDGNRTWTCPNSQNLMSDGGLSDLEFNKLPIGDGGDACNGVNVVANPIWGTIFNTPVSRNLRDALQCVQGLTAGAEDEANMPSLPRAVVAGLFNGAIANWEAIRAPNAVGAEVALDDAVNSRIAAGQCPTYQVATYPVPTDTRVRTCRRPQSSGTNTQFRVKFLNAPCVAGAQDQLPDNTPFSNDTTDAFSNWQNTNPPIATAPAVIQASGSSDMGFCVSAFADAAAPATQRWAIGIQSLENNVSGAAGYRFIKIDDVAPTVDKVVRNQYFDWVESVWAWQASGDENAIDVQQALLAGTGAAADVGALVTGSYTHPFGASGLVALNTIPGNNPTIPVSAANPVATATHASGGTLNSCRTPFVNRNVPSPWVE